MKFPLQSKIDCHVHVFDPDRFPYASDTWYRPSDGETGTADNLGQVLDAHGVQHALIVGPNSGYGLDNRCLLDTLAASAGRYKGIAVVRNDVDTPELQRLQAAGVVGVAFNATIHGPQHYLDTAPLLRRLADLGLWVQVQVQGDQMAVLAPLLLASGARILIDHAGRPDPAQGLDQPGFQAVLALARSGRAAVKLSGHQKYSTQAWPYDDALPCVRALVAAYGLDACVWASDWPFLKASERLDMGPLLRLVERWWPDAADRQRLMWDTPRRLFGF
jgi:predicted TIM-barrel fold metal-dependent hydrolase